MKDYLRLFMAKHLSISLKHLGKIEKVTFQSLKGLHEKIDK